MWKKIILLVFSIGFAVVLFIGLWVVYIYFSITGMFFTQQRVLYKQGQAADDAYLHQPPQQAIWVLEQYGSSLEKAVKDRDSQNDQPSSIEQESRNRSPDLDQQLNALLKPNPQAELMWVHFRLCKLYSRMSNEEKSQSHYDQAQACSKRAGISTFNSKEDCLKSLDELDTQILNNQKKRGK